MKKTKLFTFIIILTLVMPTFQVYAAESKDGTEVLQIAREYIISKAIEAFPEYSSKIQGENELALNTSISGYSTGSQIIFNETRWLSENEVVTYSEYDNGIVTYAYGIVAGKNVTDEYDMGSGVVIYTMNMWLQCASSEDVFIVNDVSFIVRETSPGSIISLGDVYEPENIIPGLGVSVADWAYLGGKVQGTVTEPAYIEYSATFYVGIYISGSMVPIPFTGILRLEVGTSYYNLSAN